jgi:quinolinate synthase
LLDLLGNAPDHLPPIADESMSDDDVIEATFSLKKKLKDKVVILGHHYQQDDIIQFADHRGDSLELAKKVQALNVPYVIFCGVHFMAETADMLTSASTKIILPDLRAGCSMADMANAEQIEKSWKHITSASQKIIIPITYINSSAALKAFVGKNEGSICTSSNAKSMVSWALSQGEQLLFFPDQHLGRNTCFDLGIKLEEMVTYNPLMQNGGVTDQALKNAKVILWYGYCSVHQGFNEEQIKVIKKTSPDTTVIVHPECAFPVVRAADLNGSTSFILKTIRAAKPGSKFAVGTEIHLVNRLRDEMKNKGIEVRSLSPYQCLCTTMYKIRPRWLLHSLRQIDKNNPQNIISVDTETTKYSLLALERMFKVGDSHQQKDLS